MFRLNFKLYIGILEVITLFLPNLGFKREDKVFLFAPNYIICFVDSKYLSHEFKKNQRKEIYNSSIFMCTNHILLLFFSLSVMCNSLQPHGLQHSRLPCPSLSPRDCSNSCPLSR